MSEVIEVKIEKLHPDVVTPEYKHDDDSGMDVRAFFSDEWLLKIHGNCLPADSDKYRKFVLGYGGRAIIPTGIKVAIPNGYEIQVRPRSGMTYNSGITVINTPGTVDAGYRGEIGIILHNTNIPDLHANPFVVNHGDRIAQLVLQKVPKIKWIQVDSVDETERGEGGFGSTGTN